MSFTLCFDDLDQIKTPEQRQKDQTETMFVVVLTSPKSSRVHTLNGCYKHGHSRELNVFDNAVVFAENRPGMTYDVDWMVNPMTYLLYKGDNCNWCIFSLANTWTFALSLMLFERDLGIFI